MICFWPLALRKWRLISKADGPEKPKWVKRKLSRQENLLLPSTKSVSWTSRVMPDNDFKSLSWVVNGVKCGGCFHHRMPKGLGQPVSCPVTACGWIGQSAGGKNYVLAVKMKMISL